MNEQKEGKNLKLTYILTCVVLIIVGLVLLIFPKVSLTAVCFVLGALVLIKAISKLFDYIKLKKVEMASSFSLISIIASFALALVLFIHPQSLLSVIPSLIGLAVVIYGVVGLTSHRSSKILSIIEIVIGAVVLSVPFAFASAVTAVVGVALILLGILTFVSYFKYERFKEAPKVDINGYKEVHYENVNNPSKANFGEGENTNAFNGESAPNIHKSETFEEAGIEDAGEPNPSYDNLDFNEADIKEAEFKDINDN